MKYSVEEYLDECKFEKEMKYLRKVILKNKKLEEESKWGKPTYTYNGANVLLIHEFKEYFAILFNKGILLKDKENKLVQQTPNVYAARHFRFKTQEDVKENEKIIEEYIEEAIEVEDKKVPIPKDTKFEEIFPEELNDALDSNEEFRIAFNELTPGRQRGYMLYFSQAKKEETRISRIEKNMERIFQGKGIEDK